ncbi:hypothetical protein Bhyg_14378 [Pseudolycoriella hygida]|uniref:Uncharacterized protein n=1 Tax=Pseudolycoriella hygida TaxID=35572 RepID=A0A9Q0MPS9_9DIPT|nr:hypothetical protein Bhyg_14378 [Pseudolycoriella hygida]
MLRSILMAKLIFLIIYQGTGADEKPYEVQIQSFEPVNYKKGIFDPQTLRVTRKGRNQYVITGDFSLLINLGDDSSMVYEVLKKSDVSDDYTSLLKDSGNICKFTVTNTNFYPRFRSFTNFPEPDTCPFPKGNYTIKDFTLDENLFPDTAPNGAYLMKTVYTKDNQNLFGYNIALEVTRN